jgi:hypothetical protein
MMVDPWAQVLVGEPESASPGLAPAADRRSGGARFHHPAIAQPYRPPNMIGDPHRGTPDTHAWENRP